VKLVSPPATPVSSGPGKGKKGKGGNESAPKLAVNTAAPTPVVPSPSVAESKELVTLRTQVGQLLKSQKDLMQAQKTLREKVDTPSPAFAVADMRCFACNEFGHFARNCPHNMGGGGYMGDPGPGGGYYSQGGGNYPPGPGNYPPGPGNYPPGPGNYPPGPSNYPPGPPGREAPRSGPPPQVQENRRGPNL